MAETAPFVINMDNSPGTLHNGNSAIHFLKKHGYLFGVLLIEGAALMAVELMGAKLLAPFYGSSLYVWTAVLSITVLGLTVGYHFGGRLAARKTTYKHLAGILGIAAALTLALPYTAVAAIALTARMNLVPGICTASLLLLVPPMFFFGLVGPLAVRLLADRSGSAAGHIAGTVYFTSTLGGIAATFLFGYFLIPESGLRVSALVAGLALAALPFMWLFLPKPVAVPLPDDRPEAPQPVKQGRAVKSGSPARSEASISPGKSVYLFAAVEGAVVMAIELLAARMLAPWFGASLYVWVAVIGITLFSLACGYFAGGRLADKRPGLGTIHQVLLIAAMFVLCMHFSKNFSPALNDFDIRVAVVLAGLFLLLPPLVFLGMVPTLLIKHIARTTENAGAVTGRVFAVSSASGILALPLMGFWIIPNWGLTGPSIALGLLVGIVPCLYLLFQKKYVALLFAALFLFSFSQRKVSATSPDVNILTYTEGLLGQVLVADVLQNGAGDPANDRVLFVNRMGQTIQDKNTHNAKWNYIHFSASAASALPENSRVLLLGLGGGSVANVLQNNMQLQVDAVELDARIGKVARTYFDLNPRVQVIIDDARHYLETTEKTYDLIFFDVFKGDIPPPHVLSVECFEKAKTLLNKDGFLIVNFNGFLNGDNGIPGRALYATLQAAGFDTRILPTPGAEEERNTLFLASLAPRDYRQLRSPLLHKGLPVPLDSLFRAPASLERPETPFRDDRPNLDRLVLPAAAIWRKGYNDTYTRFFLKSGVPLFH